MQFFIQAGAFKFTRTLQFLPVLLTRVRRWQLEPLERVVLHGLQWATDLNGREGVIVGPAGLPGGSSSHVKGSGRSVVVRLDGDGREVAVKAERLHALWST